MVITAPVIAEVMPEFLAFCDGAVMVAHNADFDMSFIKYNCDRLSIPYDFTIRRYCCHGTNAVAESEPF